MWVFDGEQWIEEGGSERKQQPEPVNPPADELRPELQVIEIPLRRPEKKEIPPFPMI